MKKRLSRGDMWIIMIFVLHVSKQLHILIWQRMGKICQKQSHLDDYPKSSHLMQLRSSENHIFCDLAWHFTWKLATQPENYKQFASIFPNYDTDLPHNGPAVSWILKVCPVRSGCWLAWRVNLWCPNFGIRADMCTLHPSAPAFVWLGPPPIAFLWTLQWAAYLSSN